MTIAIVFVLAVAAIFSDTALGRNLKASLSRFRVPRPTRGQAALVILLLVFTVALVAVLKSDGLAIGARAAPEVMAWVTALDVATYVDVVALAALGALALRLRVVWAFIRSPGLSITGLVQAVRRRWSARAHRRVWRKPPKSDDDGRRWAGAAFA